jgi:hypothetical protein
MPPLPSDLRRVLENAVIAAREEATTAAGAALKRLAVEAKDFPPYLTPDERSLRLKLRAAARQLGDQWIPDKQAFASLTKLTHEVAYEHWHRMLFARFLAENNLLIHPDHGVPVDLATVAELAQEEAAKSGTKADTWATAGRYAASMLPQIFRQDDPALAVLLAPEHQQALEKILESLPPSVFTTDDSLGWVYQFWQSAEKDRVNAGVKGGDKITGETLPAVTQLFTEHYMVLFLLHNTVGAWHAAKQMAKWSTGQMAKCQTEADCRAAVALPGYSFDYLRFVKNDDTGAWRPAAGAFAGWPKSAAELKVLDPCCGSGHFLVAALELLTRLRMAEERLEAKAAALAVIADNLFGLELDARCTQIAAFNVAQAAWRLSGDHFAIPELHIACAGLAPNCSQEQWLKLAETRMSMGRRSASPTLALLPTHGREAIKNTLRDMHALFSMAPELGSLIDPTATAGTLGSADWETVKPFLTDVLAEESKGGDADALERAVAAQGMAKAAEILSGEYTLVITNVPYLGRGGQGDVIKAFCEKEYPDAKADLATVFAQRMLKWVGAEANAGGGGTTAVVTPQNWLFLTSYKKLRERLLKERTWNMVVRMGEHAFESSAAAGAFGAMMILSGAKPAKEPPHIMAGIDVSAPRGQRPIYAADKAALLRGSGIVPLSVADQGHGQDADATAQGAESAAVRLGGTTLQPARTTRQADGTERQAIGTERQETWTTRQADGTTRQETRTERQADGTTRQVIRRVAEPLHGAPAREAGAPGSAHGAQRTADGGPAMAPPPPPAASPESGEGPEDQTPADAPAGPADGSIKLVPQAEQLKNPDARIVFAVAGTRELLSVFADSYQGIGTSDNAQFLFRFWELARVSSDFRYVQIAPDYNAIVSGCNTVLLWENGEGRYFRHAMGLKTEGRLGGWKSGGEAWGKPGIAVSVTGRPLVASYLGTMFDTTMAAVVPKSPEHLAAVSACINDPGFEKRAREMDQALSLTEHSLLKVPFDLAHWQKVAAEKYPGGLPEPQSDDPTQWLFHGHPAKAEAAAALQVAVARLVGYRWPAEHDQTMRLAPEARARVEKCKELERFADDDGVVPLVAINKEQPGAERVRALLEAAFGSAWTPGLLNDLLAAAGAPGKSLDDWLKHDFWAQHCAVFHHRPFVWQIWDGKKDGFNILVHYHRLAEGHGKGEKLLQKITYTYLGDWIAQQQAAAKRGEPGADLRLKAAQDLQKKLEAILAGEPPYDIFVRWKPLHEQPIGWNPDINDGVRLNIRPFVAGGGAGVLRGKVNVKWTKDRGKEPESIRPKAQFPWFWSCPEDEPPVDFAGGAKFTGVRLNDLHYTRDFKEASRRNAGAQP